ncbi:uncharacterized protein PtrM4_154660 [Pyrenophora tritici-repentis]|uniref:Uncharacterized protein n=1 Tax=Pyrenophora tritici-repentis TaxID=45151 RepID=A0A834RG76_9PLEO|nr:hypothetical protein PtrM4_154660 [Pyrenophora tritici-repentis]
MYRLIVYDRITGRELDFNDIDSTTLSSWWTSGTGRYALSPSAAFQRSSTVSISSSTTTRIRAADRQREQERSANGTRLYRRPAVAKPGQQVTRGELANCCPSNSVYKYEPSNGRPDGAVNSPKPQLPKPMASQAAGNAYTVAATWAKMVQPRRLGAASSCVALVGAQFKGLSPNEWDLYSIRCTQSEWLSKANPTQATTTPPVRLPSGRQSLRRAPVAKRRYKSEHSYQRPVSMALLKLPWVCKRRPATNFSDRRGLYKYKASRHAQRLQA